VIAIHSALRGRPHTEGAPAPSSRRGREDDGWGFREGDEIVPGRHAIRLLGGGSRYEASLAWDDDLHCLVVVKILRPDQVRERSALRGLATEKRNLEALQHPVLLRCFDSVLDGPSPHLVLEFLEGPRLSTLIRKYGPLALEQVIPLGLQLCSALHYMGTREMLHLDVKPQNTVMGAPPRLIDLNVARSFEEGRRLDHLVGTDAYMSPEQCHPPGFGGVGPEADVWGLGVTLYEAATGTHPFPRSRPSDAGLDEYWPQAHRDPLPLPDDFPRLLGEPILACLERRPKDRPRPSEFSVALEELVAALPRQPVLGKFKPKLR
jgi:serine/threonine protein kinase